MSKLILFQGDSITDGGRIRTNDWDLNHQMGHSYPFLINAKLGSEYPEKDFRFINNTSILYCQPVKILSADLFFFKINQDGSIIDPIYGKSMNIAAISRKN